MQRKAKGKFMLARPRVDADKNGNTVACLGIDKPDGQSILRWPKLGPCTARRRRKLDSH